MAPTFFASKLNAFVPVFQDVASKVVPRPHISRLDGDGWLTSRYPQLVQKWKDELFTSDPSAQPLVNVTGWLSRTTLDIMGQGEKTHCSAFRGSWALILIFRRSAGFDIRLGSLDNAETELTKMYANLLWVF
jgi:hypothetical protein